MSSPPSTAAEAPCLLPSPTPRDAGFSIILTFTTSSLPCALTRRRQARPPRQRHASRAFQVVRGALPQPPPDGSRKRPSRQSQGFDQGVIHRPRIREYLERATPTRRQRRHRAEDGSSDKPGTVNAFAGPAIPPQGCSLQARPPPFDGQFYLPKLKIASRWESVSAKRTVTTSGRKARTMRIQLNQQDQLNRDFRGL